MIIWKLESDVNDFVKKSLTKLWLQKHKDFNEEWVMSDYLKEALAWGSKREDSIKAGRPDFNSEKFVSKFWLPIIIENKLWHKKLIAENKWILKNDMPSIKNYAVNGAIYYAQTAIASGKYHEVIAIGVAGDNEENVEIFIYLVFGYTEGSYKKLEKYTDFSFLDSDETFGRFYQDIKLKEEDRHRILIQSRKDLQNYTKQLNKLMHNHNITAPQRVLYVSGMLLAMQNIEDENKNILAPGLNLNDLQWSQADNFRDGKKIITHIEEFLKARNIEQTKRELMLASFSEISKNKQRDIPVAVDSFVSKYLPTLSSINKQIFTFIYYNIFEKIDGFSGHLDVMGEMYSEFLKYALGDGKELGIVLTPPYVTKMMVRILWIGKENKVMDLATGSAWFLISAMEMMVHDVEEKFAKWSQVAKENIDHIKRHQLLGVELNAEMYTLAATNMILRGDGASNIQIWNTFDTPEYLYENFKADRILLNPPFSFKENGMPFIEFGLNKMQKWWLGAIIIQDSAGSGKATMTNKNILKHHTLLASIKMPTDLFQPMAGVQTSIYIFRAWEKHDYEKPVKFIDFRNDGYKRTVKSLQEIDNPVGRYEDIIKIFKAGKNTKDLQAEWNLDEVCVEDFITDAWNDWNFDQHKKIDTTPTLADFKKTVSGYLSWEVSQILQKNNEERLGKS